MTITNKILFPQGLITDVSQTLYTATLCNAVIDSATVTNTSSTPVSLNVYLTVNGAALSNSSKIVSNKSILGNETYNLPELVGHIINPGDLIITTCGTTNVLSMAITGREIT